MNEDGWISEGHACTKYGGGFTARSVEVTVPQLYSLTQPYIRVLKSYIDKLKI